MPSDEKDQDEAKGAIESDKSGEGQANENAPALDENGLPADPVKIAEDVIGANEDESEG